MKRHVFSIISKGERVQLVSSLREKQSRQTDLSSLDGCLLPSMSSTRHTRTIASSSCIIIDSTRAPTAGKYPIDTLNSNPASGVQQISPRALECCINSITKMPRLVSVGIKVADTTVNRQCLLDNSVTQPGRTANARLSPKPRGPVRPAKLEFLQWYRCGRITPPLGAC